MELKQAIYVRRAVRDFTAEPVEEATLRQLIEAAVQAPSAMNRQPWLFCVVRDRALLDRIAAEAKARLLENPPTGLPERHLKQLLGDPQYHLLYRAPVLLLICSASASPWAIEDCALAAQNLMLAACDAGLGSCWIGFVQGWLASPEGKAALGLPENCQPVAPIVLGHPASLPPPVPRHEPEIRWIGR